MHTTQTPRLAQLECRLTELRLAETFTTAHAASNARHNWLITLTADDGRVGLGEAAPYYGEDRGQLADQLADWSRQLVGRPLGELAEATRLGFASARAGVEIAVLDVLAQAAGLSLSEQLGLGGASRAIRTSFTLGQADPDTMRRKALAATAAGWDTLKVKVGTPHDVENLAAVRAVAPAAAVRVDANGAWTVEQAVTQIGELSRFELEIVEQPLPPTATAEDWARLRAGLAALPCPAAVPLFADESVRSVADVARLGTAVDGVVLKLSKSGGPSVVLAMLAEARRLGRAAMIGCMVESSIGVTAAAHLAHRCDHADLDGHLLLSRDPFVGAALGECCRLSVPLGPGLGVRPRA